MQREHPEELVLALERAHTDLWVEINQRGYCEEDPTHTFLSDFDAPDPVHPVVYSPYTPSADAPGSPPSTYSTA